MKKTKIIPKRISESDVTVITSVLPELTRPKDHYDDLTHEESDAIELISIENQIVWCCIRVSVIYDVFKHEAYAGCCSFERIEDFISSPEYKDMVQRGIMFIQKNIDTLFEKLMRESEVVDIE